MFRLRSPPSQVAITQRQRDAIPFRFRLLKGFPSRAVCDTLPADKGGSRTRAIWWGGSDGEIRDGGRRTCIPTILVVTPADV